MTRLLLGFMALVALMSPDALAGEKKLTGDEIKAAFSGAKTSITTGLGTFLHVWKADGTMTGEEEQTGYWQDEGKWWVNSDRFCRQWTYWIGGKAECFGVTLDGELVKWWRADGSQVYPDSPMTLTK